MEVARKLGPQLGSRGDLDEALSKLRDLEVAALPLSDFEKSLVSDAQLHA